MMWSTPDYVGRLRQEMDSLFNHYMGFSGFGGDFPPVNIYSGEDELILTADIPGIDVNSLDITCEGKTITLKGERMPVKLGDEEKYIKQERSFGSFVRSFTLPYDIEQTAVHAQYKNGVLLIKLPLSEAAKPKKIEVSLD